MWGSVGWAQLLEWLQHYSFVLTCFTQYGWVQVHGSNALLECIHQHAPMLVMIVPGLGFDLRRMVAQLNPSEASKGLVLPQAERVGWKVCLPSRQRRRPFCSCNNAQLPVQEVHLRVLLILPRPFLRQGLKWCAVLKG